MCVTSVSKVWKVVHGNRTMSVSGQIHCRSVDTTTAALLANIPCSLPRVEHTHTHTHTHIYTHIYTHMCVCTHTHLHTHTHTYSHTHTHTLTHIHTHARLHTYTSTHTHTHTHLHSLPQCFYFFLFFRTGQTKHYTTAGTSDRLRILFPVCKLYAALS